MGYIQIHIALYDADDQDCVEIVMSYQATELVANGGRGEMKRGGIRYGPPQGNCGWARVEGARSQSSLWGAYQPCQKNSISNENKCEDKLFPVERGTCGTRAQVELGIIFVPMGKSLTDHGVYYCSIRHPCEACRDGSLVFDLCALRPHPPG